MKNTKIQRTLFILEEFHKRQDNTLDAYDEILLDELNVSIKQMGRILDQMVEEIDSIELIMSGRRKTYKLIKPIDLFVETFKNTNDISWLFNMAHDGDPEVFKELEQYTKKTKHVFQFKNTPFEDTATLEEKEIFKTLKRSVKNREYAKITFKGKESSQDNLKCLKLIFMEGNWYLAYVNEKDHLRFGRISFMEKVEYATKAESFQPVTIKKQMDFLNNIQNAMTLYDKPKKIAKLKASGFVSKYFQEGMKPFLSSQKFEKVLEDASVVFTVEYTQFMEILPFVQSWLPNITILEPRDLKEKYLEKLQNTIMQHK